MTDENNKDQGNSSNKIDNTIPIKRQDLLKWDGWGYKDTALKLVPGSSPYAYVTGGRYSAANTILPYFAEMAENVYGIDFNQTISDRKPKDAPKPIIKDDFIDELKKMNITYSLDDCDRLYRAHGHTLYEIYTIRHGTFDRVPDIVVWPDCHDTVEKILWLAVKFNVVIVPFGGGTNVTKSLLCTKDECRMIVSLDMSQMSKILWINKDNLTAKIEAGIVGQDLERKMHDLGYTVGHEPDSCEFSSLGGWIVTRASGMKKNTYGNIEDLAVQIRAVTPRGAVERYTLGPRISSGPDVNNILMGSEGIYGIITEVILKIRPLPEVQRYGSVIFPDFESGVAFMREVARQRCQPTSIRLMDNDQFKLGHSFRPQSGFMKTALDKLKMFYVTSIKRFDLDKLCVCTLLFEGNHDDIMKHEAHLYQLCRKFYGLPAGQSSGKQGYFLTFLIAYIRDLAVDYNVMSESFETAVPWDKVVSLVHNVKHKVAIECQKRSIKFFSISSRVTQTYDAGACIYFYFSFNAGKLKDPVAVYEEIEDLAREEILGCGGSISHHHGVGKLRAKFLPKSISPLAIGALSALKEHFDPQNILGCNNLVTKSKL